MIVTSNTQSLAEPPAGERNTAFQLLSGPSDRFDLLREDFSEERTRNELPDGPPAAYRVSGVDFSSASEATCAVPFEKYIPDFSIKPGESYQVEIGTSLRGNSLYADFQIHETIVEFHPPRVWRPGKPFGDFESRAERREYKKEMRHAEPEERPAIKKRTLQKLGDRYYQQRRRILDESSEFRQKELVVAYSDEDLYDKVIAAFGENIPDKDDFLKEFATLRKEIYTEYPLPEEIERRNKKRAA